MIVDDDPNIREIAQMSLEDEWSVILADSGSAALEMVAVEKPDLILLDRMMPGMDGLTTLEQLRLKPEGASVPVIFLTAKVLSQELDDYKCLDVAGVLAKPFDPMTLSDEIEKLLEKQEKEA